MAVAARKLENKAFFLPWQQKKIRGKKVESKSRKSSIQPLPKVRFKPSLLAVRRIVLEKNLFFETAFILRFAIYVFFFARQNEKENIRALLGFGCLEIEEKKLLI